MSFLFGKSKKTPSALPAATREIASSHGPETRVPTANGMNGPINGMERRGTIQNQALSQAPSVNGSLESMRGPGMATPLGEPSKDLPLRARAESDLNVSGCPRREQSQSTSAQTPCLPLFRDHEATRSGLTEAHLGNHHIRGLSGGSTSQRTFHPFPDMALRSTPRPRKRAGYT